MDQDGNYVFRVSNTYKLVFPRDFIEATDVTTNESFDFLIKEWVFQLNDQELPLSVWLNNDIIDGITSGVQAKAESVIDDGFDPT